MLFDTLIPEVGTNGTKILITFVEPKGQVNMRQVVHFSCGPKRIEFDEEDAVYRSLTELSLNFPDRDELSVWRVVHFDVNVVGIGHTQLSFIWVDPIARAALIFVMANGFVPALNDELHGKYGKPSSFFFLFFLLFFFFFLP